jgi:hypothetical protein
MSVVKYRTLGNPFLLHLSFYALLGKPTASPAIAHPHMIFQQHPKGWVAVHGTCKVLPATPPKEIPTPSYSGCYQNTHSFVILIRILRPFFNSGPCMTGSVKRFVVHCLSGDHHDTTPRQHFPLSHSSFAYHEPTLLYHGNSLEKETSTGLHKKLPRLFYVILELLYICCFICKAFSLDGTEVRLDCIALEFNVLSHIFAATFYIGHYEHCGWKSGWKNGYGMKHGRNISLTSARI